MKISNETIKPATFRLAAQCLNQMRHREPRYEVKSENFQFCLFDVYSCDDMWDVFNLIEWRPFLLV